MAKKRYDFSGWATRNDLKCSDGRTIRRDAFKDNDGTVVPLVWNHQHNEAENVLGHALLENRKDGVYAYCTFNDTENAQTAKSLVEHRDITALSIYANKLKQVGGDVLHGAIREVSLVLAGANPGAYIESVMAHADGSDEECIIYTGSPIFLQHSDDSEYYDDTEEEEEMTERSIEEVIDSMDEDQQEVLYGLVGEALAAGAEEDEDDEDDEEYEVVEVIEDDDDDDDDDDEEYYEEDDEEMNHNVFEDDEDYNVLCHADIEAVFDDARRYGSLKDACLQHGIEHIDYLFPDAQNLKDKPDFINTNPIEWVEKVMKGVHHTPFSRIKMMFADITADEARAKGYVKGNLKLEEVITLLKRTVTPTTVYKKQKLDRDDVIDIVDFDVVAWLKAEMRLKLDEELARAFIFGDGRSSISPDKISETNIIPVVNDTTGNLYAMAKTVTKASGETDAHAIIRGMVKAMDDYQGSGNVTVFMPMGTLSDILLEEDTQGHRMYKNVNEVALAMNVNQIVKVPAAIVPNGVAAIALDLKDYNVGADKGGAINMFDDFDIDYNQQKYLIETRCSGALTVPHSAIVLTVANA